MASRRSRIKVVAKIPQGRKNAIDEDKKDNVHTSLKNIVESIDSEPDIKPPVTDVPNSTNSTVSNSTNTAVTISTNNVVTINTNNVISSSTSTFMNNSINAVVTNNTNTVHSDTEYPPPPPSPSKINRTRIKAIPRLDYRKTSFSASESEEESRKNNRIRNDSICSTTSALAESTECMSPQRPREIPVVSKKSVRSRKIVEARREFQRKFGLKKPERHKLTMMDLIVYNPDSNPMEEEPKTNNEDDPKEVILDETNKEAIKPSDDTTQNENENNDEENAMPVPQIKIGPSGEIIIDEQSLVIERKEVIQQREEMAKTKIVNGDFDTGYGIYKRHKRGKKWTHQETVRFYKAINIIGTDFTLMTELFPNRTRRELKMKFKKEENSNKLLVNRAVMQPGNFDFDELKNEVELEEKEMEEMRKQKELEIKQNENEKKVKQEKMARKAEKRKLELIESEVKSNLNKPPKVKPSKQKPQHLLLKKPRRNKRVKRSFVEDSDADESDMATQSESDDEVVVCQGPTRSGRIPKIVRKYEDDAAAGVVSRYQAPPPPAKVDLEPGSIMIVTETGPNGEPVYKIFMVTPEQTAQPLQLPPDVVARAIDLKSRAASQGGLGVKAKNIMTISATVTDDETEAPPVENNVTIPADENIKTMKSDWSESDNEKINVGFIETSSEVKIGTNLCKMSNS